jgi:hypothetical protein
MPNVPEDKFEGVNYVFYDKEQQNTQQEELNALFVIEAHSYVEEAVLDEVLTLSTERQDPLPPKFRVLSPTTTTDELAEGSVEQLGANPGTSMTCIPLSHVSIGNSRAFNPQTFNITGAMCPDAENKKVILMRIPFMWLWHSVEV